MFLSLWLPWLIQTKALESTFLYVYTRREMYMYVLGLLLCFSFGFNDYMMYDKKDR